MPNFVDTSHPDDCLFCRIVAGKIKAEKVFENDHVIAFMDIGPVNPGHVLVAPKIHSTDLFDIPAETAKEVMLVAQRVAIAVKEVFSCPGLMLFQANGRAGEQTVFHFHMHVVPRHENDGAGLIWPRKQPEAQELAMHAAAIVDQLISA